VPRLHRCQVAQTVRSQTAHSNPQIAAGLQPSSFPSGFSPFYYARSASSFFRGSLLARRAITASGTNRGTKTSIPRSCARTPRRRVATCQTVVQPNRAWSGITMRSRWMALGYRYPRRRFRTFQHPMEGPTSVRHRRSVRPKERFIVSFCRLRRELAASELAPTSGGTTSHL
jgi:hypothetical protein